MIISKANTCHWLCRVTFLKFTQILWKFLCVIIMVLTKQQTIHMEFSLFSTIQFANEYVHCWYNLDLWSCGQIVSHYDENCCHKGRHLTYCSKLQFFIFMHVWYICNIMWSPTKLCILGLDAKHAIIFKCLMKIMPNIWVETTITWIECKIKL
jgi:hypothetical protein